MIRIGPLCIRADFLLVLIGVGLYAGPIFAGAFVAVIAMHELGHALASPQPFRLYLQMTGGVDYIKEVQSGRRTVVLLAGVLTGALSIALGLLIGRMGGVGVEIGRGLYFAGLIWTGFQLMPFPPMDGGLLIEGTLQKLVPNAVWVFRLQWLLGLLLVAGLVYMMPQLLEPAVWLTGMALVLSRSYAGYIRHLDAYKSWEKGDHRAVIAKVKSAPDYLDRRDRGPLLELGVLSAIELEDRKAVERFSGLLPAYHSATIKSADWLLRNDQPYGAQLAERAFDALDAEQVKRHRIEEDRWADLALRLAVFEAVELRPESALGLLERALELGFDDLDRIEAEGAFQRLHANPRWAKLIEALKPKDPAFPKLS